MRRRRHAPAIAALAAATLACVAVAQEPGPAAAVGPAAEAEAGESVWDEVLRLYEAAREAGESVPKDVEEFVRRDLAKLGDWEYKVVDIGSGREATETLMNDLGGERWECFAVVPRGERFRLFFRRPVRTYLERVPVGELWRFVPAGGG